nr:hypothetical protein L204_04576 [Cryptococcus depauperatus CBS 7855]
MTVKRLKIPPPLPSKASANDSGPPASKTVPLKPMQGVSKVRGDGGKSGYGRHVVFVTRRTGLGTLMGRCKSLIVDEGYTFLKFYAVGAAIPQAILLLYALLDLLPYPKGDNGMWYEIKTGSVECVDQVDKRKGDDEEDGLAWLKDVGVVEEHEPEHISRIKSSMEITFHISSRQTANTQPNAATKSKKRNRPSKRARAAKGKRLRLEEEEEQVERPEGNEEDFLNA